MTDIEIVTPEKISALYRRYLKRQMSMGYKYLTPKQFLENVKSAEMFTHPAYGETIFIVGRMGRSNYVTTPSLEIERVLSHELEHLELDKIDPRVSPLLDIPKVHRYADPYDEIYEEFQERMALENAQRRAKKDA